MTERIYKPIVIVDEEGSDIGSMMFDDAIASGAIRSAARVMLMNERSEILITKRSRFISKPLLYDNSAAGHRDEGESYETTAYRELTEELGISTKLHLVVENMRESSFFVCLYLGLVQSNIVLQPDEHEVDSCYWWSIEEFERRLQTSPDEFSPSLVEMWPLVSATLLEKYYELRSI